MSDDKPVIATVRVGDELPTRRHTPTNLSLFLYNAAVWNGHRIHYDAAYTTEVEGHLGVVIDGPLQGDWLSQIALNWVDGAGKLVDFGYSNRIAAHLGDTLSSGGRITAIDEDTLVVSLELFVANEAGEVISPGTATVLLTH